jgi:hypothetical protein
MIVVSNGVTVSWDGLVPVIRKTPSCFKTTTESRSAITR